MASGRPGDGSADVAGAANAEWEDLPGSCHICLIFDSDEQRDAVVGRYLGAGLARGELLRYFAVGTPPPLAQGLLDDDAARPADPGAPPRVLLRTAADAYYPDGRFDPQRQIAGMVQAYDRAGEAGFPGIRSTGEMRWALGDVPGADRLVEYERLINTIRHPFPHHGMCQYDARLFDGATLFQVLQVHPQVVAGGHIVRNPYFVAPEAALA